MTNHYHSLIHRLSCQFHLVARLANTEKTLSQQLKGRLNPRENATDLNGTAKCATGIDSRCSSCRHWPEYGFDCETTPPAVATLMACAVLHVDQLAGQDPSRCAVLVGAVPAPPGDRLIERRAIALVQLPALPRQLEGRPGFVEKYPSADVTNCFIEAKTEFGKNRALSPLHRVLRSIAPGRSV